MSESDSHLCLLSLPDRHLGQSCVRDDHGVDKRSAAVHLPHLLRHARRHVRLLWIPDQVSQFPSVYFSFYCSKPLCAPKAGEETLQYNIEEIMTMCTSRILMATFAATYGFYIFLFFFSSLPIDFSTRQ